MDHAVSERHAFFLRSAFFSLPIIHGIGKLGSEGLEKKTHRRNRRKLVTDLAYMIYLYWFKKCSAPSYFSPLFSLERYGTEAKFSNTFTFYWKRCLVHLLSLLTYEHLGWYVALEIKRLIKVFLALCPMIHGRKIPGIIKKINKALGKVL